MAEPESPASSSSATMRRPLLGSLGSGFIVVGALIVAFALTMLLRPYIASTVFVFMYGAVAVSAFYAGAIAGIAAAIVSVILVLRFAAPNGGLDATTAGGLTTLAAFLAVSAMVSLMARSLREARRRAERTAALLRDQATDMAAQQAEAESLAADLEQSTVELETSIED